MPGIDRASINRIAREESPLPWIMRPDLVVSPVACGDELVWRVKDPVCAEYFELSEHEYFLLQHLDGHASLATLRRDFESRFAPLLVSVRQIQRYLSQLTTDSLVFALPGVRANATALRARHQRGPRNILTAFLNPLAIRLPTFDCEPVLKILDPLFRTFVTRLTMFIGACFVLGALLLVALRFENFESKLPEWEQLVSRENLIYLFVAVGISKILHELAHALTCRRFGGECHRFGILILFFTPTMYCDVSDAWLFPRRWHRVLVSSAGVITEVLIAAGCTFLWWFSQPGLIHSLCLSLMIVCSVSTLLINGNPLLKYDGYYVLSDLAGVPNLYEQARRELWKMLSRLAGVSPGLAADVRSRGSRTFLLAYGIASGFYRVFVLGLMLWLILKTAAAYDLPTVGRALVGVILAGSIGGFAMTASSMLKESGQPPGERSRVLRRLSGFAAVCVMLSLLVPLPRSVSGSAESRPADAEPVFVTVPGRLIRGLREGRKLSAGEAIAELTNETLELDTRKLIAERDKTEVRLRSVESRRAMDPEAAAEIPALRQSIQELDHRVQQMRRDQLDLKVTARKGGVVIAPRRSARPAQSDEQLATWDTDPLRTENTGCWLETGTLLCYVGDPALLDMIVTVSERDIELIALGDRVRLTFPSHPGEILHGVVTESASSTAREPHADNRSGTEYRPASEDERHERRYRLRVKLDRQSTAIGCFANGRAKIEVRSAPLWDTVYRALRTLFRIELP